MANHHKRLILMSKRIPDKKHANITDWVIIVGIALQAYDATAQEIGANEFRIK